jgi:hypothetical protein
MVETKYSSNSPIVNNSKTELLIDFKDYPLTEFYQRFNDNSFEFPLVYDQELRFCSESNHAFLGNLLPQDFIYNSDNYNTALSSSIGSVASINNFFTFIDKNLKNGTQSFIDIGANDSTLLKKFSNMGAKLIGIDPHANSDDINIICLKEYFENVDLSNYAKGKKTFLSSHTLEHIYDPRKFMKILSESSSEEDQFFFQFPSLELLLRDNRFDQIHHQHIQYFSIQSISQLISEFGFQLIDHHFDSDHFGTLMVSFKKTSKAIKVFEYENFYSIGEIKDRYSIFCSDISNSNKKIEYSKNNLYCYGASLMLPILHYYMPSMSKTLKIIDQDKSKSGLSYANFDFEIIEGSDTDLTESDVIVTAVASKLTARKIITKLTDLKAMNIILPLNTI